MPSIEPTTPKLSIRDIFSFSDTELVQYMKQKRSANSGFNLEFDSWENLAKEQCDKLTERLKVGALQANNETLSRPVDLDTVAARLHEISGNQDTLPPVTSRSPRYKRSPTPIYNEVAETKTSETIAYHDLIKDGGRPLYPISLQEEKDNREYNEEEKFATFVGEGEHKDAESTANEWAKWEHPGITESQYLKSLRVQFEKRQDENCTDNEEEGFSAFLEERKRRNLEAGYIWPGMAEDEYRQDHGRGGFPEYIAEAKRHLAKHGFTRSFQLDEDPARQDKLTTWIEYLNFEYSYHDRYKRSIKRLRPKYNEAWKKLVDSEVLRPGETDETVYTIESAFQRASEREQAEKAVASTEAAAKAALSETEKAKIGRSRFTKQERTRRLTATHFRLVTAKEMLKTTKRRSNLITEFIQGT
ncbi:hypothetical protein MMYC01_203397 [Madurella mycetomatis]|uniref:Uncharacterized protein n=1 Tax=Madurella mycetomatis TaxID=100816 RepID=A0A175WAY5_9PEZI|nr:hypothetical protein MMYC01_203397 [Madurella mycetomatis]